MSLVANTIVAGRFRLERELGRGGMGAVWLAHHIGLDLPCAVKFILDEAARSPELRARFQREAKAAARIRSPYVVQILDYGLWQDMPYIAMEYLQGEDLGTRLARKKRLDARETATVIGQVARGLGKAHAMGIVHRDIKPSNIFLARDEEGEVTKVVDFGIAKTHDHTIGDGQTRTGALIGTPCYMSPEQAQGTRRVDHRSDLWALGVVAFQCMTGRLPFESDGFGELVLKIVVEPLPIPSRIAPVPPAFDGWWARAVARDPAQRLQSARELAEALYLALGISATSIDDMRDIGPPASSPPTPPSAQSSPSSPPVVARSTPPARTPTPEGAAVRVPAPAPHGKGRTLFAVITACGLAVVAAVAIAILLRTPASPVAAQSDANLAASSSEPDLMVPPAASEGSADDDRDAGIAAIAAADRDAGIAPPEPEPQASVPSSATTRTPPPRPRRRAPRARRPASNASPTTIAAARCVALGNAATVNDAHGGDQA